MLLLFHFFLKSKITESASVWFLLKWYNDCDLLKSFFFTAVHTIAHLLNVEWYSNSMAGLYGPLASNLSMLGDSTKLNTTYLNPIRSNSTVSP